MNSYPIGDLRPIGPHAPDNLLTKEQHAFAITLGRILAEQWEQQQQHGATGVTSLSGQTHHPDGEETSSDGN
jgi:hypothetical protein